MHPSLDAHYRYESIMHDMAVWICERTWGGHEKGCPNFGTDNREGCECIFGVLYDMHKAIHDHDIALLHNKVPGLPDFTPKMMEMQAHINELQGQLLTWRTQHGRTREGAAR